jgi:hypothetical protein
MKKTAFVRINSKINLVSSDIGVAAKEGGCDLFKIDTTESFNRALIDASLIAYAE